MFERAAMRGVRCLCLNRSGFEIVEPTLHQPVNFFGRQFCDILKHDLPRSAFAMAIEL